MIFNFLWKHATQNWYFPSWKQEKYAYLCWIGLQLFYPVRYKQQVLIERLQTQRDHLKKEYTQCLRKLDIVLRINAGCESPYSSMNEESIESNSYADLDDAEFLSMQKEWKS